MSTVLVENVIYATSCSFCISLAGIIPLLFIPLKSGEYLVSEEGKRVLARWLCFAVGSLLGDVFIHIFPECIESGIDNLWGTCILAGIVLFFSIEKIAISSGREASAVESCLNLGANCLDNFTHGLTVGGSFLVSNRFGFLTTFCILIHEVPHEVGDFVILLRSGYSRLEAAKAQLFTASFSILGALFAFVANSSWIGLSTAWILPFTSGGFLYIGLVSLAPSLQKSTSAKECLAQISLVFVGLLSMAFANLVH